MSSTATVKNYFNATSEAARYARSRPSVHAHVLSLVRPSLESSLPMRRALDVACGTGHSTVALIPYAESITGIDVSAAMMAEAPRDPRIEYSEGAAESLPFADGVFDLITVASAYHWLDHDAFLSEAWRVLMPGGYLLVYNSGSTGRPSAAPGWDAWLDAALYVRFPKVARHFNGVTSEEAQRHGFHIAAAEVFPHEREHTCTSYAELLMTRSNVIRALDAGEAEAAEVRRWITKGLAPFFPGDAPLTLKHEGKYQLLRRE